MEKLVFSNPVAISTIFPPTSLPPPTSRNESLEDSDDETGANTESNGAVTALASSTNSNQQAVVTSGPGSAVPAVNGTANGSAHPVAKSNGSATPADQGSLRSGKEARLKEFKYVDFRYYRFLLHPVTGNFYMSRWVLRFAAAGPEWKPGLPCHCMTVIGETRTGRP